MKQSATRSAVIILFANVGQPCAFGQNALRSPDEKVAFWRGRHAAIGPAKDAKDLVAYFRAPDASVRTAAYVGGMINASFSSADQIFALRDAAAKDSDVKARQAAMTAYMALRAKGNFARATGEAVTELERLALTGPAAQRGTAIEVLGSLRARTPDTFLKLMKDNDPSIRLLSIKPSAHVISDLQGSEWPAFEPLLKELIGLIMREPAAREAGGLALRSVCQPHL